MSKRPAGPEKDGMMMNCWYDGMMIVVERSETVCVLSMDGYYIYLLYILRGRVSPQGGETVYCQGEARRPTGDEAVVIAV